MVQGILGFQFLIFSCEGPETATRGGVNRSLKFLVKLSTVVPKSPRSWIVDDC